MSGIISLIFKNILFLISYIQSPNSFPKPLTQEEERKYFEMYRNGDVKARNILIEKNLRLVAHISKKYLQTVTDKEDLISTGVIGLIKGVESFNPEKSSKLSTYISRCIENEILMVIRLEKKTIGDLSLDETIGTDKEGNKITLLNVIAVDDSEIFDSINLAMEVKMLYREFGNELEEREKNVIEKRYGLSFKEVKTQREIAEELKISRSYVSRIEKKAINKLRRKFKLLNCD